MLSEQETKALEDLRDFYWLLQPIDCWVSWANQDEVEELTQTLKNITESLSQNSQSLIPDSYDLVLYFQFIWLAQNDDLAFERGENFINHLGRILSKIDKKLPKSSDSMIADREVKK